MSSAPRHPTEGAEPRPSYQPADVLTPSEVQRALGVSDSQWDRVRARLPWSDALGPRSLRISWGRLLAWLEEHERKVA